MVFEALENEHPTKSETDHFENRVDPEAQQYPIEMINHVALFETEGGISPRAELATLL